MKKILFEYQGITYQTSLENGFDISIPLRHGDENPNCYYADPVEFSTIRSGDFVGSVAEGGSVNYQKITFTPHGNGTHTECNGHITADPEANISNCINNSLFFAELVSLEPQLLKGDQVILCKDLEEKLKNRQPEALILRTLPNSDTKKNKKYSGTNPTYLEGKVGTFLANQGIKHLLVDLPSVDREVDQGVLAVHKGFWGVPNHIRKDCTITELIFVENRIQDGNYLLNLQVSNFYTDAAPSRPVLYPLEKV